MVRSVPRQTERQKLNATRTLEIQVHLAFKANLNSPMKNEPNLKYDEVSNPYCCEHDMANSPYPKIRGTGEGSGGGVVRVSKICMTSCNAGP